ncbi:MAG TPA: hypothetical protein VM389_12225 [Phycisphaerae bacterium]|nr:hypothetical protein [Phycisphaerae bacterium]
MKLYQRLRHPDIRRLNRDEAGDLIGQVCGEGDEKLAASFRRLGTSETVAEHLEQALLATAPRK